MAAKKRKKLTARDKALNATVKKGLQARGVIPPDKPRLNRAAFARDVLAKWRETEWLYGEAADSFYQVVAAFLPRYKPTAADGEPVKLFGRVTPEHVGVLKLMAAMVAYKEFWARLHDEGRESVSVKEMYDAVIAPIIDL